MYGKETVALFLLFSGVHVLAQPYNYMDLPDEVIRSSNGRIRGLRDTTNKDFVLGGLFPVHSEDTDGQSCGEFRTQGGVDRVEAMLYAIDQINADPNLLPNITLGYDIRDTCYVEQIGLDEAVDIILTGSKTEIGSCSANEVTPRISNTSRAPTIGIIGAASSQVTIPIAGLCRLFTVPQISYSSTSAILNNRERYTYFYRTVPSDNMEARAIIDLIRYFGWTYISTVFSRDSYGQSGIDDLVELAEEYGICIDLREGIEEGFSDTDYEKLANTLVNNSEANVVVLYASKQDVENLLPFVARGSSNHSLTWIATSAWAQAVLTSPDLQDIRVSKHIVGLFGTIPLFDHVSGFSDYFSSLTITTNQRNPWFAEYYAFVKNCTLYETCGNHNSSIVLSDQEQEYAVPLVIDATYAFAHALNNYLNDNCDKPLVWDSITQSCEGQNKLLNGSILLEYIRNVSFTSPTGNSIFFDSNGNIKARYTLVNYQVNKEPLQTESDGQTTQFTLQMVGSWDRVLTLNSSDTEIQFGMNTESGDIIRTPANSDCGMCRPGKYRREVRSSCCGICEACLGQNYSTSSLSDTCSNCMELGEMWGNNPTEGSTGCVNIPEIYLRFRDPWSIIIVVASIIGMGMAIAVAIIFAVHWKTPIITSSSRELMVLILCGVLCSFAVVFFYISPPSVGICTLQRISLWFSYSLIFSSVTIKIVRIARIFIFQKSGFTKLKCMQSYHQVLLTFLLVLVQLIIVFFSLVFRHPTVDRELRRNSQDRNKLPEIVVTCEPDPLVALVFSIVYETGLVVVSAVLGMLSFKCPANFNEAKSICCATFGLIVIWIAFIATYLAFEAKQELQNAAVASAIVASGYVVLICLFGPRIFVVLFWKDRNSKWFSRRTTEGDVWENTTASAISEFHETYKSKKQFATGKQSSDTLQQGKVEDTHSKPHTLDAITLAEESPHIETAYHLSTQLQ